MGNGRTTRALLTCGVVGPPLFVGVFLIDGATRAGYDPWRHWVSHLSLGGRGWLGVANLILFGLLTLGFSLGLRRVFRSGKGSIWGPRLISLLGLGLILGGVFAIDPGLGYPPGTPQNAVTWHGQVHDLAGALVFGSMTAVCFVLARRFAGDSHWRGWTPFLIFAGATVAASFVACSVLVSLDFAGVLPGAPSGLFERVSLVAGGAWISLLALRLSREKNLPNRYQPGERRKKGISMNQKPSSKRALIIGGGIAGPVLSMFLQRAGLEPVVYEGRPAPDDGAGAFLNLAPNGLGVLDTLGVGDEVRVSGTPTTSIAFLNHRGKKLGQNPEKTLLLKRGRLNRALREAAVRRGVPIEFGRRLQDVEVSTERTVVARFEDGSEAEGDLLIGCDGIHSTTRRSVFPEAPSPRYTGVVDCGTFVHSSGIDAPPPDGVMRMTFGKEGFFGYQVVPSGEIYWFQNFHHAAEPVRKQLDAIPNGRWRATLLGMHEGDHHPIAEIIRSTGGRIDRWPVYEMPPIPSWHDGPVCLIGDAAHATTPHVGQGASLAMEDAIVLARCLRDIPDTGQAFAAYESIRRERVEKIVAFARRTGNRKSPSGPFGRAVRDLVLPFFLKISVRAIEPVYSYRVRWDEKVPA